MRDSLWAHSAYLRGRLTCARSARLTVAYVTVLWCSSIRQSESASQLADGAIPAECCEREVAPCVRPDRAAVINRAAVIDH